MPSDIFSGVWNKVDESEPFGNTEYLVRFRHKGRLDTHSTVAWWSSEGWVKMHTVDDYAQPDDYLLESGGIVVTHWADIPR